MLLADKHDLQQKLRLNLLQIEEKELNFYTQNCYTIGTQAALLAGFAFGAMAEVDIDAYHPEHVQILWLVSIVLTITLELGAVVRLGGVPHIELEEVPGVGGVEEAGAPHVGGLAPRREHRKGADQVLFEGGPSV